MAHADGVVFCDALAPVNAFWAGRLQELIVGGAGGGLAQAGQSTAIGLDAVQGSLKVLVFINEDDLPIGLPGGGLSTWSTAALKPVG